MSSTQIDVAGMQAAAAAINETAGNVMSEENAVKSTFAELSGSWRGQTATTYGQAMDTFYSECDRIVTVLKNLSETVNKSANQYSETSDSTHQLANAAVAQMSSAPAARELPNFGI